MLNKLLIKLFGTKHDRDFKRRQPEIDEIRRLFDYPPETVDGLVAMAARLVNNSQIIVGVGKRGIQRQRLFIATHGAVGIIPGHMYVSQIIDKFRRFRPEFLDPLEMLQGLLEVGYP